MLLLSSISFKNLVSENTCLVNIIVCVYMCVYVCTCVCTCVHVSVCVNHVDYLIYSIKKYGLYIHQVCIQKYK